MKVKDKLTEAALADRLDEVLDRASQGEEFAIERDGEVIAIIRPPTQVRNRVSPGVSSSPSIGICRDLMIALPTTLRRFWPSGK